MVVIINLRIVTIARLLLLLIAISSNKFATISVAKNTNPFGVITMMMMMTNFRGR